MTSSHALVEEWKKDKSKEVEISKSLCDGDADDSDSEASIPQKKSGKVGNQHFARKENEESDSGPVLPMKEVRKNKKEKWNSKESEMTPVLEEDNLLTSDLLQRNDDCRLSEGRLSLEEAKEKRTNADIVCDKLRGKLRTMKKQYMKEVKLNQQLEQTLRAQDVEVKSLQNILNESDKKEKDLLCENRLLQDEIARLRMEVDTIKTQTQEQKPESSEDIETIKYLRNSIKLKRERLAEIISDHSRQLRMLSSENTLLKSELDFEKREKEKLKTEVQSNLHELSAVLSDLHRSQKSQKDLEFAYQKERDEWSVVKENMTSYSNILFQKLVEAERKFNSLEVELCNTKDILSQKTLALEGVQRDLSQAVCEKKEMELKYHNEQRKMHTYLAEEELAEEPLAQLRSRNTELQQQLSHAQDKADNKEKTMMAMQTQFRASVKQLQAESKCQRLLLEARNKELTNKCSHLKEKQKRYKTERAERELQEAQGQRTATMRWPTMDNYMKKLEEENFNLKVIIENQAHKMEQLQENLSRARSLQISLLHQLTEARRLAGKMEDHMQMPDIENSQLKARSQKQADRPEQLPHLPSSTGSTQIPALENLEQPRKNQIASRGSEMELSVTEMELSIADAESELSSILASEKLEEYPQVRMKDLQTLKCLSTKVRQLRENLAEVKTHLSGVKQMDRSLHTILTTRPIMEATPIENPNRASVIHRELPTVKKCAISPSNPETSSSRLAKYVAQMQQELEKNMIGRLEQDDSYLETECSITSLEATVNSSLTSGPSLQSP
ncbi:ankyrin repeat domain-containing protein 26-like [Nycticebus coucang]|uniref:ankyrin repeat domain-containing protein 26-like n=1 Tax=Nycticebus coucang TaxID=9470 RepID=UPI00234C236C|nr:ankyrin repeat domain-containing protein 26-like [Nycticebus coucang]